MEKIKLKSINIDKLKRIKCKYHMESQLYHDNKKVYKIFYECPKYKLEKKERKIELLNEGPKLPHVVMPIDKLVRDCRFAGYTMKYIYDSIPLYDIKKRNPDYKLLFKIISTISKNLQTIHSDSRNIMVGDLNFNNIILDKWFNPYFIDFDSCKIDSLENENIPAILWGYFQTRNIKIPITNQNTDKISLLLSVLDIIFEKDISYITTYEYDKKAEYIKSLTNMKSIVLEMKKARKIPSVPYVHELIDKADVQPKRKKRI